MGDSHKFIFLSQTTKCIILTFKCLLCYFVHYLKKKVNSLIDSEHAEHMDSREMDFAAGLV